MSGHKVVAVLEAFKEGYVYGGPVYRRKQSVLSGAKRPNYAVVAPIDATTTGASSSSSSSGAASSAPSVVVDLVLSHRGAFKLRSRVLPPKTSSIISKSAAGGGTDGGARKRFSKRGAAATTSSHADPNNGSDSDDDIDPLDADAMMMAAANGEDIQRLYAQLRAKREARRQAKEEAGGAATASSSSKAASSKPEVVWRQEHCFVRLVDPLLGPAAEEEEDRYRRREEEDEEERLLAEEAEAKAVLQQALSGGGGGGGGAVGKKRYENADEAAAAAAERNKMSVAMEKRRKLTPAALANDASVPDRELYGFTVHYFAIGKAPKAAHESTEIGRSFAEMGRVALAGSASSASSASSVPVVRQRTYVCGTLYEQQEWLMVYRNVLLNYWHERLEASVIGAPEVFQYQCFAMTAPASAFPSIGGSGAGPSFLASPPYASAGGGAVIHLVLSTTALYVLPRATKAEMEADDAVRFVRMPLESLGSLTISTSRGALALTGGPFVAGRSPLRAAFFAPHECTAFVVELQRVWEMSSPAAASADGSFPFTLVA